MSKKNEVKMRFSAELAMTPNEQIFVENDLRISVLSNRIIRIEKGDFIDLCSQTVVCRNFDNPQFKITNTTNKVLIVTKTCLFEIDKTTLKTSVLFIGDKLSQTVESRKNLGGTARTLDGTFGVLGGWKSGLELKDHFFVEHIRKGIFAKNGVCELDDSKSCFLNEDGSICPPKEGRVDKYVLAFKDDYLGGLQEFYKLTGHTPILPKYVLGNWWSRYHAYTQEEYLNLMDEFEKKNIPLTVATIDMDWHIVKNVPKDATSKSMQGAGWTGYTFEKALFPDHKAFLKNLKDRNLAVTMNLHPRDGVRYFEEQYEDMARACDVDPSTKQPIEFDLTNEKFLNAYFDILHHPYEEEGVDFWWIDWQQGTKSAMAGLDPLWLLNHYHTLDICRGGKNGVILSRYAGLGSHRYPIGFSGDTVVCWKSLRFQPYFTALASNAGYTWWSHDIGGHLLGHGDNELYLRWLQFGVFSPINRLHSNNMSLSKEPWNYPEVESMAEDFLRLRHRLLPFLYSANVRTAKEGIPLIAPMYYYQKDEKAYSKKWRNQYCFGENMIVAPVTRKGKNGVAKQRVWLPDGEWTHFFSNEKFGGGREFVMPCTLDTMPVFVKKGSVIPMLEEREDNNTDFDKLYVKIYLGDCKYDLYDENSRIHFDIEECGKEYSIRMKVDGDCKTISMKIEFVNMDRKVLLIDGDRHVINGAVEIECKDQEMRIVNA